MSFTKEKIVTDVLIIGAGPTGLMAANQLMRFGIENIIIDSKSGPTIESRALAVTARSMELYQQMGLEEDVMKSAKPIDGFILFTDGRKRAEINIKSIGENLTDFNHFLLTFEQNKNETLLYQNYKQGGNDVLWNTAFVSYRENKESIDVKVSSAYEEYIINTKYLIACDGAKSPVRHQMKMPFKGGTYENKFFVADTILHWSLPSDKLILSPSQGQFAAFFPIKGQDNFRIVGTIPNSLNEKEEINFKDLEAYISQSMKLDIVFEKVNWFSLYKLHHRCVDRFSQGRIFLAGDAAHIHSPAGGQGMNTGLQDAHNLTWKLAYVLKGYYPIEILESYHDERKPFAEWLLRFTDRGFTFTTSSNKLVQAIRNYFLFNVLSFVVKYDAFKQLIFKNISQTKYNYRKSKNLKPHGISNLKFQVGDRLPYVHARYYTKFVDASHYLVHIHRSPLNDEARAEIIAKYLFPIAFVENSIDIGWEKFGIKSETFILVRPDMYIEEVWQR